MDRLLTVAGAVVVLEIIVIVEVAQRLGVVNTIGLLILVSLLGWLILKAQGVRTLRRLLGDDDTERFAVGAATQVAGPWGLEEPDRLGRRLDCPVAPELLRL